MSAVNPVLMGGPAEKSLIVFIFLPSIVFLLMLVPGAYAETTPIPPKPIDPSVLASLEPMSGDFSPLDNPTFQRETFEWESSPCDGGGTVAYVDGDDFECGWTYGEDPDSIYIEIERTTNTNWGSYAAFWDGPDVGIGSSGLNWIVRWYNMNIPSPSGKYVSWKHKQLGGTSANQCYYILLYDSEADYAYSDCVMVSDSRWNYKALGDDSTNGWKYMRTNDLDQWTTVTVADGLEWNEIKYIHIERAWAYDPTNDANDIMDDVFLVEDYSPDPITGLGAESKGTTWVKLDWDTWDADGDFKRYEIQYRESGGSWSSSSYGYYQYMSNFNVTGLSSGTTYDFRVRVKADNGDTSTWRQVTETTD